MKKLVVIGPIDPFESKISGTRNYVMSFLNSLDSKEEALLCGYTTRKNEKRGIRNNIGFLPLIVYKKKKESYLFPQTFKFIVSLFRHKREIISKGDVLHIQRFDYALPFLFPSKKRKIAVYFHGAASKGYLSKRGFKSKLWGNIYQILEKIILPRVDKIVCVSKKDEEFYQGKYPRISKKLLTIPIPVNLDEFKIKTGKKELRERFGLNTENRIILYIGRFSKVKGIDLIIRAFAELNKTTTQVDLVLVGRGEEERELRELTKKTGLKNIHFLGDMPHDDVPDIMNCADVLVMASITEGMPTVILEALACGLPVVATRVGDIGNVITNERIGFLVENRSEEEFKTNLIRAIELSHENKLTRRELAEKYSSKRISMMILDLHRELVATKQ